MTLTVAVGAPAGGGSPARGAKVGSLPPNSGTGILPSGQSPGLRLGAAYPASTGAAGTTAAASHLRPGTRGSLIFPHSGLTAARQPPAEAKLHDAVARHSPATQSPARPPPEPAPCGRAQNTQIRTNLEAIP